MTPRQRKQKRRLFLRRLYAAWWTSLLTGKQPLFGKLAKQMTKREADERWAGWGF